MSEKKYEKQKLAHKLRLLATVYIILCLILFFHFLPFFKTVISTSDICPINLDHNIAINHLYHCVFIFFLTKIDFHIFCLPISI